MKPITSVEDAQRCPERSMTRDKVVIVDGLTMHYPELSEMVATERDDNAILLFKDTDGRIMAIGYDSEGAYKYEVK